MVIKRASLYRLLTEDRIEKFRVNRIHLFFEMFRGSMGEIILSATPVFFIILPGETFMKITQVVISQAEFAWPYEDNQPSDRQVKALDIYPEFNQLSAGKRVKGNIYRELYLEIKTDDGPTGLWGPIDEPNAFVIKKSLAPYLIGRDPLAGEQIHDQMLRMDRHGRSGHFMMGISSVDCALWDLKGKFFNQPVYRLLGGPTRRDVPAYASMLGFSLDPDNAVRTALEYQKMGYSAQKWFFRYGPGDGAAGKEKNMVLVRVLREALGAYYPLMFDAYMGWDLPYALEMARLMVPFNITWLEEPLPPEHIEAFGKIRSAGAPVATGEHVYTRWQVKEFVGSKGGGLPPDRS